MPKNSQNNQLYLWIAGLTGAALIIASMIAAPIVLGSLIGFSTPEFIATTIAASIGICLTIGVSLKVLDSHNKHESPLNDFQQQRTDSKLQELAFRERKNNIEQQKSVNSLQVSEQRDPYTSSSEENRNTPIDSSNSSDALQYKKQLIEQCTHILQNIHSLVEDQIANGDTYRKDTLKDLNELEDGLHPGIETDDLLDVVELLKNWEKDERDIINNLESARGDRGLHGFKVA